MKEDRKSERRKAVGLIISCFLTAFIFGGATIYFGIRDGWNDYDIGDWFIVLSGMFFMLFFGIYGIIQLKRGRTSNEKQRDSNRDRQRRITEKRRKTAQKELKHSKDMFQMCKKFAIESEILEGGIMYLCSLIVCLLLWKQYEGIPIIVLFLLWIVVTVVVGIYCIKQMAGNPVKQLCHMIENLGYDLYEVNEDFMQGTVIVTMRGFINIGFHYTTYFSLKGYFVVLNKDILRVEKVVRNIKVPGSYGKGDMEQTMIHIVTKGEVYGFLVDDTSADMILAEYGRWGICTESD